MQSILDRIIDFMLKGRIEMNDSLDRNIEILKCEIKDLENTIKIIVSTIEVLQLRKDLDSEVEKCT